MAEVNRFGRSAQVVAIILCAVLLIALVVSYLALLRSGAAGIKQTDFIAYYSGSHLVLTGHAGQLYNFPALGRVEAQLVHPLQVRNGVLPYVYPPFFALLLAPLAALPYPAAYGAWLLINCGLLAATTAVLGRYARLGGRGMALLVLSSLSFLPVFVCLAQGQTSLLLLALLTATFLCCRSGDRGPGRFPVDLFGGCALALALVKPPLAVPFLLTLILTHRWRALAGFAAAATILFAIPAAVLGIPVTAGYAQTLLRATAWHDQFGYGPAWNHSLAGFTQLVFPAPVSTVVTAGLVFAVLALLVRAVSPQAESDLALGISAVAAILIGPHVLIHDLSLLLLPVVVAVRYRPAAPLGLTVLLTLGYLAILVGLRTVDVVRLQLSVLAMISLLLWLDRRRNRLPATHPPVSVSAEIPLPPHAGPRVQAGLGAAGRLSPIPAQPEDT